MTLRAAAVADPVSRRIVAFVVANDVQRWVRTIRQSTDWEADPDPNTERLTDSFPNPTLAQLVDAELENRRLLIMEERDFSDLESAREYVNGALPRSPAPPPDIASTTLRLQRLERFAAEIADRLAELGTLATAARSLVVGLEDVRADLHTTADQQTQDQVNPEGARPDPSKPAELYSAYAFARLQQHLRNSPGLEAEVMRHTHSNGWQARTDAPDDGIYELEAMLIGLDDLEGARWVRQWTTGQPRSTCHRTQCEGASRRLKVYHDLEGALFAELRPKKRRKPSQVPDNLKRAWIDLVLSGELGTTEYRRAALAMLDVVIAGEGAWLITPLREVLLEPVPGIQDSYPQRFSGVVTHEFDRSGGYIRQDGGWGSVPFTAGEGDGRLSVGLRVAFDVKSTGKGLKAVNIEPLR